MEYPKITEEQVIENIESQIKNCEPVRVRLELMQAMKDPVKRKNLIASTRYQMQAGLILNAAVNTVKSFDDGLDELKSNRLRNPTPKDPNAGIDYDYAIWAVENLIVRRLIATFKEAPDKYLEYLRNKEDELEILDIIASSAHAAQLYGLNKIKEVYSEVEGYLDHPDSEVRSKALQSTIVLYPSKGYMNAMSMMNDPDRQVSLQACAQLNLAMGFEPYSKETLKELGGGFDDNYGSSEFGDLEPY